MPKMITFCSPVIVYGIKDLRKYCIDYDWLSENYDEIDSYISDALRGEVGNYIYGYECATSEDGGIFQATINDEAKADIQKLYKTICAYYRHIGKKDMPQIGYHLAISCDYDDISNTIYIPEVS